MGSDARDRPVAPCSKPPRSGLRAGPIEGADRRPRALRGNAGPSCGSRARPSPPRERDGGEDGGESEKTTTWEASAAGHGRSTSDRGCRRRAGREAVLCAVLDAGETGGRVGSPTPSVFFGPRAGRAAAASTGRRAARARRRATSPGPGAQRAWGPPPPRKPPPGSSPRPRRVPRARTTWASAASTAVSSSIWRARSPTSPVQARVYWSRRRRSRRVIGPVLAGVDPPPPLHHRRPGGRDLRHQHVPTRPLQAEREEPAEALRGVGHRLDVARLRPSRLRRSRARARNRRGGRPRRSRPRARRPPPPPAAARLEARASPPGGGAGTCRPAQREQPEGHGHRSPAAVGSARLAKPPRPATEREPSASTPARRPASERGAPCPGHGSRPRGRRRRERGE